MRSMLRSCADLKCMVAVFQYRRHNWHCMIRRFWHYPDIWNTTRVPHLNMKGLGLSSLSSIATQVQLYCGENCPGLWWDHWRCSMGILVRLLIFLVSQRPASCVCPWLSLRFSLRFFPKIFHRIFPHVSHGVPHANCRRCATSCCPCWPGSQPSGKRPERWDQGIFCFFLGVPQLVGGDWNHGIFW